MTCHRASIAVDVAKVVRQQKNLVFILFTPITISNSLPAHFCSRPPKASPLQNLCSTLRQTRTALNNHAINSVLSQKAIDTKQLSAKRNADCNRQAPRASLPNWLFSSTLQKLFGTRPNICHLVGCSQSGERSKRLLTASLWPILQIRV